MGFILDSSSDNVEVELRRESFKIYGIRDEYVELDYADYKALMELLTSPELVARLKPEEKFMLNLEIGA